MADTLRALSAIQTLFADSTTGTISAQDLRDFLVSVTGYAYTAATITSSPATLDADDVVVLVDGTSAAITVNLPAIASNQYKVYTIKAIDVTSGVVTIDGNASETIDGATTQTLTNQYECITIIGGPSEWHIIADNRP